MKKRFFAVCLLPVLLLMFCSCGGADTYVDEDQRLAETSPKEYVLLKEVATYDDRTYHYYDYLYYFFGDNALDALSVITYDDLQFDKMKVDGGVETELDEDWVYVRFAIHGLEDLVFAYDLDNIDDIVVLIPNVGIYNNVTEMVDDFLEIVHNSMYSDD